MWNFLSGGSFLIPFVVLFIVIAFFAMMRMATKCYVKVSPNKAVIFYGRKHKLPDGKEVGYRIVSGGAKLRMPLLEETKELDLNVFSIDLEVKGAPNKDGVLVNIKGVANVKILSDQISLFAAAERFIDMKQDQIKSIAFKNLEGHLRAIIGRLTVEEIVSDRSKFNQEVLGEAAEDLKKIGMGIDVLTIQEIDDDQGYIRALGQKRTAEVKRDATIGTAEADRDALKRASTARREGAEKENENLAMIAEAEKIRDVRKAIYLAEVQSESATAAQAGPLAMAKAKQAVVQEETEVIRLRTLREAEVAQAEADKREKQLMAEVIKPADAQKQAAIIEAEGEKAAKIAAAEAEQQKRELEGQGEAAAIRAKGTADADVIRLKLLAEAEGVLKKAEAFKQLNEAGRLLQIMEAAKELIPASLEKLASVVGAAASPLASVDQIRIVDFGGSGSGPGAFAKLTQVGPEILRQLFAACKEAGLDISSLQSFLKISETKDTETE